jgi:Lectin C-type domain/PEP-CTERM motif
MKSLHRFVSFFSGCLLLVCAVTSFAADVFNPQNGHYYRLIQFPERTWEDARLAALTETFGVVNGYLATITSANEQLFVASSFSSAIQLWGAWLGGFQPSGSPEPAGNWRWVTGEPFAYTNWASPIEPNNANNNENQLQLMASGNWNDLGTSEPVGSPLYDLPYLVEFSVPEPSSLLVAAGTLTGVAACWRRRRSRF